MYLLLFLLEVTPAFVVATFKITIHYCYKFPELFSFGFSGMLGTWNTSRFWSCFEIRQRNVSATKIS